MVNAYFDHTRLPVSLAQLPTTRFYHKGSVTPGYLHLQSLTSVTHCLLLVIHLPTCEELKP